MDIKMIKNAAAVIVTALAIVAAVLGADDRYGKKSDLEDMKNEIINEMRLEVTKNRAVMILNMQRDADDLEFQMLEIKDVGNKVPRYIIEKHTEIIRQIKNLQATESEKKN
jgi:hypothetical protein